jgi:predicted nucleic acid-binding protein
MRPVLLDTGALVAYLDRAEKHHAWAMGEFEALSEPLWICEAVLTEACFLLAELPKARFAIGELLKVGALEMAPIGSGAQPRIFALMEKYRQVPMSYADACLLWLAESHEGSRIFTLDSDFNIYRLDRGRVVSLIAPF